MEKVGAMVVVIGKWWVMVAGDGRNRAGSRQNRQKMGWRSARVRPYLSCSVLTL
jgi:hypothetical protein